MRVHPDDHLALSQQACRYGTRWTDDNAFADMRLIWERAGVGLLVKEQPDERGRTWVEVITAGRMEDERRHDVWALYSRYVETEDVRACADRLQPIAERLSALRIAGYAVRVINTTPRGYGRVSVRDGNVERCGWQAWAKRRRGTRVDARLLRELLALPDAPVGEGEYARALDALAERYSQVDHADLYRLTAARFPDMDALRMIDVADAAQTRIEQGVSVADALDACARQRA